MSCDRQWPMTACGIDTDASPTALRGSVLGTAEWFRGFIQSLRSLWHSTVQQETRKHGRGGHLETPPTERGAVVHPPASYFLFRVRVSVWKPNVLILCL
jgi:hypothetical protein